jgi:hypothetical protein
MLEVGSVTHIEWHDVVSHGAATYDLWYSTSGPAGPWIVIDIGLPPSGIYDWVVPDTPSTEVRVRVRQDNVDEDYFDISDSNLSIVKLSTGLEVDLEPERDATIYDDGNGTNANGSGIYLFTGRTEAQNESAERRALLVFPIEQNIPEGSTITSVSLELMLSKTRSGSQTVSLHRLLEDWSEGPSDPSGNEGGGTSALDGDVTWNHREFPGLSWSTPGASFVASASASLQVGSIGSYAFSSAAGLVADVQGWLDDPSSNFGWVLVVDQPPTGSAKRFNSRENSTVSGRPTLRINYEEGLDLPVASFTFSPANPRPGQEVQFSDTSSGGPTSWLWDFGDGQTSDEQNPTHTYANSGSRTVTLGVSNASGSDSTAKELRVGPTLVRRPSRRVAPGGSS